ncbi:MAG TPA: sulfatase-like hydrolase/transferase, partial [Oceanipulchritudo sp.]|nr:sulfatase-like hydrolase/transferase [Oceanipulchritudo sp.]
MKRAILLQLALLLIQPASLLRAGVVTVPAEVNPVAIKGATPRNVVFILSDDHRFDAMSFMGHPLARTPQMDRMAAEGAHLRNAFVTTSLCSPSRAS